MVFFHKPESEHQYLQNHLSDKAFFLLRMELIPIPPSFFGRTNEVHLTLHNFFLPSLPDLI
jgi:hypothetical protein